MGLELANAQAIKKGDFILQPDLNIGSWGGMGSSGFGFGATLNAEYAVHDYVSVGAYIGDGYTRFSSGYGDKLSFNRLGFGARGVFHFWSLIDNKVGKDLKSDKIDFYLPVHLGYHIFKYSNNYEDDLDDFDLELKSGQFRVGVGVGIRYYFNDRIGINLETGGMEISYAKLGATIKF